MTDPQPYTPLDVPPDTSQFVYRYVTKLSGTSADGTPIITSELTKIAISQP